MNKYLSTLTRTNSPKERRTSRFIKELRAYKKFHADIWCNYSLPTTNITFLWLTKENLKFRLKTVLSVPAKRCLWMGKIKNNIKLIKLNPKYHKIKNNIKLIKLNPKYHRFMIYSLQCVDRSIFMEVQLASTFHVISMVTW